jgi:hypothetical protein
MLSFHATHSLSALKSKERRAAQLAEVRKRRGEIYKLFAERRRVQQKALQI